MPTAQQQQQQQQVVEAAVSTVERALDDEIERLDNLNDDELATIRRRRVAELRRDAERKKRWRALGHGDGCRLLTEQREFFEAGKHSERFVCIFYRPSSSSLSASDSGARGTAAAPNHAGAAAAGRYAEQLLRAADVVARAHLETRFARMDAERAPWLCERLGVYMMPSLALVRDGNVQAVVHGLDEVMRAGGQATTAVEGGGRSDMPPSLEAWFLERALAEREMLTHHACEEEAHEARREQREQAEADAL